MSLLLRLPPEPLRRVFFHLASEVTPSLLLSCRMISTGPVVSDKNKAYSHTLLLPKNSVPLKHKSPVAFEEGLRRTISDDLYLTQSRTNKGPAFTLLDGPPYANGNLHMGHALNRILKDFIIRHKVMEGYNVEFKPGWDCHGLPIEHKALGAIGLSHISLDPMQVRRIARQTALEAIAIQKAEMRQLGIMANWDSEKDTYRTMDHGFEIRQLRLLVEMIRKGQVTHRLRPSFYSPSSRSALAESELSYQDVQSRSIYVRFRILPQDLPPSFRELSSSPDLHPITLLIWTTTPWTLVSNMGIAVNAAFAYVAVRDAEGHYMIIHQDRLAHMMQLCPGITTVADIAGSDLVNLRYEHPLYRKGADLDLRVLHAVYVSADTGTGLVHLAPAHGHEDYLAFLSQSSTNLLCPIDDAGLYTRDLRQWVQTRTADRLVGQDVLGQANDIMIDLFRECGALAAEESLNHRYPHDWKTKSPVIIRATPQWFADISSLKEQAKAALQDVQFVPAQSKARLHAFIDSRAEWCISRQRSWGVPIPILFTDDGEPILDAEVLDHAIAVLNEKGTDHWWTAPASDFAPETYAHVSLRKGSDTLDVWFDSGSAWASVSDDRLIDVCLEGSDQHRGWFQSSLLTKLSFEQGGGPISKNIITHGFIIDEEGRKMSKSEGNGISPIAVINGMNGLPACGSDALRVWVASVDYTRDVAFSNNHMNQAIEALRKLRSVLRFMLGNISDDSVPSPRPTHSSLLDRWLLTQFACLEADVRKRFDEFAFNRGLKAITTFCTTSLSALYFESAKDILYCDPRQSVRRMAIMATLRHVLVGLLRLLAPIIPHTAEELYRELPGTKPGTIFHASQSTTILAIGADEAEQMSSLLLLRRDTLVMVESARERKLLHSPKAVELIILNGKPSLLDCLRARDCGEMSSLLNVSELRFELPAGPLAWSSDMTQDDGTRLVLIPASREQCSRCWNWTAETDKDLCHRCDEATR